MCENDFIKTEDNMSPEKLSLAVLDPANTDRKMVVKAKKSSRHSKALSPDLKENGVKQVWQEEANSEVLL